MPLAIPANGETAKVHKGPLGLLLRRERGALCLITHEGDQERRHLLGLPRRGHLELQARAPDHRVRVKLQDPITLAPGGRLRGYLAVPLPHRLLWRKPNGRAEPLLDVLPRELKTSWLGEGPEGGYIHETDSPFHLCRHEVRADTCVMVPVLLQNRSEHAASPVEVTIRLKDHDLCQLAGAIVASPRRLVFGDNQQMHEKIRPLPRQSA